MLDHVGMQVTDMKASADFYDAVLAPLGTGRFMDFGEATPELRSRTCRESGRSITSTISRHLSDPDGNNVEAVSHIPE